jgi:hypothetical protein
VILFSHDILINFGNDQKGTIKLDRKRQAEGKLNQKKGEYGGGDKIL